MQTHQTPIIIQKFENTYFNAEPIKEKKLEVPIAQQEIDNPIKIYDTHDQKMDVGKRAFVLHLHARARKGESAVPYSAQAPFFVGPLSVFVLCWTRVCLCLAKLRPESSNANF